MDATTSSFSSDLQLSVSTVATDADPNEQPAVGRIVKLANLTASSNESDVDESVEHGAGTSSGTTDDSERPLSPPPNCAICLSRCNDKCFTDACMHQFCFKCLCEWSKIKPECPLCKQAFTSIIHNVRSLDQYDQYHVEPNPQLTERPLSGRFLWTDRPNVVVPQLRHPIIVNEPVLRNGSIDQEIPHNLAQSRYEPYRVELLSLYHQENENGVQLFGSLSQLWRRYVYDRKLYALPVADIVTRQFREWSAQFYRNNPAQVHRLMPWINRDIVCLLRNTTHNVSEVLQIINDLLPLSNILGATFRRRLAPYLGDQTSHFIHELFNFARSPYDMIGYDRVVQYSAQVAEEVTIDFGSSSSDEERDYVRSGDGSGRPGRSANRGMASVIVSNPSAGATHSFNVSLSTDGLVLPRLRSNGMQSAAINLSIHSRDGDVIEIEDNELDATAEAAANAEVAAINNSNSNQNRRNAGAELPITVHIELNSSENSANSSSSECEFVLERKPPHLRTPELVSLNSESDSDVVFVDESKKSPNSNAVAANVEINNYQDMSNLYMGASTSAGLRSGSGKNWRKILVDAKTRKRRTLRSRNKPNSDSKKIRSQPRAQYKESTSGSDSSSSSSSSSSSFNTSSSSSSSSDSEFERQFVCNTRSSRNSSCDNKAFIQNDDDDGDGTKETTNSRKRRSRIKNKITEKRRKRSNSLTRNDSSSSDSSQDKMTLSALRYTQSILNPEQFKKENEGTNDGTVRTKTTDLLPWFKTEQLDHLDDDDMPSAGSGSSPIILPLNNQVDIGIPVGGRPSSSSSTSLTSTSSSSHSSTTTSSSSDASAFPFRDVAHIAQVSYDECATKTLNTESTVSSALHNEMTNSLLDFAITATQHADIEQHESSGDNTNLGINENASLANNGEGDADCDGDGDGDVDADADDDDNDNDEKVSNTESTPMRSYVNSLIEDARLPIYSDVSSDAPPQPNHDAAEDAESADIDVGGIDSHY